METRAARVDASSTWTVDGPSSTGVFAGARGKGEGSVDINGHTSTLSGKLHLASGARASTG